jgi:hypothetical protein
MWWAAALAAILVMTCDGKFAPSTAPSLRCLQPMIWQLAGLVLCVGGVALVVAGLVLKPRETR